MDIKHFWVILWILLSILLLLLLNREIFGWVESWARAISAPPGILREQPPLHEQAAVTIRKIRKAWRWIGAATQYRQAVLKFAWEQRLPSSVCDDQHDLATLLSRLDNAIVRRNRTDAEMSVMEIDAWVCDYGSR